jgi:hypothetical protein
MAPGNHLLLTRWDFSVLDRALRDLFAHTHRPNVQDVAMKLSLWGRWEYQS